MLSQINIKIMAMLQKATKGLIDYLFKETNLIVLNAITLINNVPSNKVIKNAGLLI